MDIKEVQMIVNKILEKFDSNYKNALNIVLESSIEKVGFNKEQLLKQIKDLSNTLELQKLAYESIIKKQVLKSLIEMNDETRMKIFNGLIDYISNLETDNENINYNKYKDLIIPNTGKIDYEQYKNLAFAHKDDDYEFIEVPIDLENINNIKLKLEKDCALLVEPKDFSIPNIGNTEVKFSFDSYTISEFKNRIENYINVLKKVINNNEKIIESLYRYSLKICEGYADNNIIDMNFVKKNTHIALIRVYENTVYLDAGIWDYENDKDILGGHGIELLIDEEELDNDNTVFEWNLYG